MLSFSAELLQKLGQAEEAEVAYRRLIESNPDKIGNYKAMLNARGLNLGRFCRQNQQIRRSPAQPCPDAELTAEQRQKVLNQLQSFTESFPRAAVPKRLALDVAQGKNLEVQTYT